ncbi:MAG: HAMP domain-containing sensor histidine kinase [Alphaproteobacteria bacterium]
MVTTTQSVAQNEPSLGQERIRLLNETLLVQAAGAFPWSALLLGVLWYTPALGPLTLWRVLCWLSAHWLWGLTAWLLHLHLRKRPVPDRQEEHRVLRVVGALYLINGVLWGGFIYVMWVVGNPLNNSLIIIIILGLSVGFAFQLSAHFGVFLCAMVPVLSIEILRMATAGSSYLVPYLILDPIFMIWMFVLSYQLSAQVTKTLKTGLLNSALVDDLRRARDGAIAQKALADSASKAKSSFVASMSHELRTPLNAIIGFAEIISRQVFGPNATAKYTEYAGDIEKSGRHLLALINQILDLAKIESGKLQLKRENVVMRDLLKECLDLVEVGASDKGLTLDYLEAAPDLVVHADPTALRQIFLNLLANAIKFTDEGGVLVSVHGDGGEVVVRVADTGPGIAPEDLDRIFEPFEQADNTFAREKMGSGLGLAIVAKLVAGHKGTCTVESRRGAGSIFTVRLPVVPESATVAAA